MGAQRAACQSRIRGRRQDCPPSPNPDPTHSSHPQRKQKECSSPAQPGLTEGAALATGSSATCSAPLQSSPCPPPHQTPRPSQPSSVPPKPHRKVSAIDPRRHLEGPMPRDLVTRAWCGACLFQGQLSPCPAQVPS